MKFPRQACAALVRSTSRLGAGLVTLVMFGAVVQCPAQAAPRLNLRSGAPTQLDQQIVAQLGLGIGFQTSVLKMHLQIFDVLRGKIGVCFGAGGEHEGGDDGHHEGQQDVARQGDGDGGDDDHGPRGSIKLVQLDANANGTISAVVEVYYDSRCKNTFIHSALTLAPASQSSVDFTENASLFRSNGTALGKVTMDGSAALSASALDITGDGTFTPAGGGVKIEFGLACANPSKPSRGKTFACNSGIVASINSLKLDVGLLSDVTVKVVQATPGNFTGSFTGTEKLVAGDFGKLGVAVNDTSVKITGPSTLISTDTIAGMEKVTGCAPLMAWWSVTDAADGIMFEMSASRGGSQGLSGVITDTKAGKTLATLTVDAWGNGSITYSNGKNGTIGGWILSQ